MLKFYLPSALFVVINLLILYFILKKMLFKPVTKFMEHRSKSISDTIEDANSKKASAEELRVKYEEKLQQIQAESDGIIDESRNKGIREYDTMMAKARADYDSMMEKARETIEKERQDMLREVKNQVASLALAAASKLIESNMDNEANRKLVEAFIIENEEGAA